MLTNLTTQGYDRVSVQIGVQLLLGKMATDALQIETTKVYFCKKKTMHLRGRAMSCSNRTVCSHSVHGNNYSGLLTVLDQQDESWLLEEISRIKNVQGTKENY